jgi:hypothetical protein
MSRVGQEFIFGSSSKKRGAKRISPLFALETRACGLTEWRSQSRVPECCRSRVVDTAQHQGPRVLSDTRSVANVIDPSKDVALNKEMFTACQILQPLTSKCMLLSYVSARYLYEEHSNIFLHSDIFSWCFYEL